MSEYPEHERLHKVSEQSQSIGEFLDWLTTSGGVVLAEWSQGYTTRCAGQIFGPSCHGGKTGRALDRDCTVCDGTGEVYVENERLVPVSERIEGVLARYFGIDMDVIEAEKRAMLDAQRRLNEAGAEREQAAREEAR